MNRPALLASGSARVIVPKAAPPRQAHILVRNVACAFAAEAYEVLARDNRFFAAYPTMQGWVDAIWGEYLQPARETLTDMLARDEVPQSQKDEIEEALQLDFAFVQAANGKGDFTTEGLRKAALN